MNQKPEMLISGTEFIEAVSKKRPRVLRSGHAYTPKDTKLFETQFGNAVRCRFGRKPVPDNVHVVIDFYLSPKRMRSDLDNLIKSVLDALNGVIWLDDRQVHGVFAFKNKITGKADKPRISYVVLSYGNKGEK